MCIGKTQSVCRQYIIVKILKMKGLIFYEKNKHKKLKRYRGVQEDEGHYDDKQDLQNGLS